MNITHHHGGLNNVGLAVSPCGATEYTNLSRGALYRGLSLDFLFVDPAIMDDYAEVDPALGQNVAGALLDALQSQSQEGLEGRAQTITIALVRRDDGQLVELDIRAESIRLRDYECLVLDTAGEQDLAERAAT